MKATITILLLAFFSVAFYAQNSDLTINISEISSDKGQLIVKLYNAKETFRKIIFKKETLTISNGKASVIIEDLPEGDYAFAILHDENSNGKIDFNGIHFPIEDVAASNNAKGFMGPPNWEDAMFTIVDSCVQNIKM